MESEKNYDDMLYPILCSEENIVGFFDRIFDFLNRRTDFFRIKSAESPDLGLHPGEAEKIVKSVFCQYMQKNMESNHNSEKSNESPLPLDYIAEEIVSTSEPDLEKESSATLPTVSSDESKNSSEKKGSKEQSVIKIPWMDPDCYNGARYEGYSWAQTLIDVDVRINVPDSILAGKQVRVCIKQCYLKADILVDSKWTTLKEGNLLWKINVEESTWTLVPREHIHICLQKMQERWWDSFFVGEPKLDMKSIDPSIAYEDLDQDSRAKIEELMFNERMKRLGKPTIQQSKIHSKLKDAWNSDDSPFKGLPYDPTTLDIQNPESLI